MDFTSTSIMRWLGDNLEKGKRNYQNEERRAKKAFVKKYPFARLDQFEFWPDIDEDGDIDGPTITMFVSDGETKLYNLGGTYWR